MLLLYRATIWNSAFEKRSIFRVKQLSIKIQRYFKSLKFTSFKNTIPNFITYWKPGKWKTYITIYFSVIFILFSLFNPPSSASYSLSYRYISSKIEPYYSAGFGDVRQHVGKLIFVYKVTSKIRFDILLGGGGGFMKIVAVTFSAMNLIRTCGPGAGVKGWGPYNRAGGLGLDKSNCLFSRVQIYLTSKISKEIWQMIWQMDLENVL